MPLTLSWNGAFEARPPNALNRNQLDNELRLFRDLTRQVMSQEHEFGYSNSDTGKHTGGGVTLYAVGSDVDRAALTDVPDGALFLLNAGSHYELQAYDQANLTWLTVGYPDHSELTGLDSNIAHSEFLLKTGGVVERPVNLQNTSMLVTGATTDRAYGYSLKKHTTEGHPNTLELWAEFIGGCPNGKVQYMDVTGALAWSEIPSGDRLSTKTIAFPSSVDTTVNSLIIMAKSWSYTGSGVDDVAGTVNFCRYGYTDTAQAGELIAPRWYTYPVYSGSTVTGISIEPHLEGGVDFQGSVTCTLNCEFRVLLGAPITATLWVLQ